MKADLPRLLLIGAGGLARESAEAVHAVNAACPTWNLLGFLDDDPALLGRRILGVEVIGPVALAQDITDASVVVCTGRPDNYFSRKHLTRRLDLADDRFATIIHPAASLADSTTVGAGSVLLAGVVTTASVTIGRHVAVMPGVILTHDDEVADYCTIVSGARLGGAVRLHEGAYLGAGCLYSREPQHRRLGLGRDGRGGDPGCPHRPGMGRSARQAAFHRRGAAGHPGGMTADAAPGPQLHDAASC